MRKKISLIFLMAAGLILSACGSTSSSSQSSSQTSSSSSVPTIVDEEPMIYLHYVRNDNDYTDWNLWLWGYGYDGRRFDFNGTDDYGVYARYPLSLWTGSTTVGFIVRRSTSENDWAAKDPNPDRFVNLTEWQANDYGSYHVYLKSGQITIYTDTLGTIYNGIGNVYFMNKNLVRIITTTPPFKVELLKSETIFHTVEKSVIAGRNDFSVNIATYLPGAFDFSATYSTKVYFVENDSTPRQAKLGVQYLFNDDEFKNNYSFTGDLGALYTHEATTFKVWAPTSQSMKLRIYDNGTPTRVSASKGNDTYTEYAMTLGSQGVWSHTLSGDLDGKYYTYVVSNSGGTHEVVDPYAKAAGVNGQRGMIVDFETTNPVDWENVNKDSTYANNTDASIWEVHVRDLTMDASWNGNEANRGKYAGMWESGTTYTKDSKTVKTGFDHIKELGVNAVHILPFFDHNNDETKDEFNWGYNPLNYNVIEGQYSSDPYDGKVRIREAKDMVKAYDAAGIKIIMDVVYNHLGDANGSNFNYLVPGYYFRYDSSGAFSNGSGVGNDTASERFMFKKFMVDSTAFLAKEYKFGGYRFDLMGLHTTEVMKELTDNIHTFDPDFLVYGEAWNLSTTTYTGTGGLANQNNLSTGNMKNIGAFSDQLRNAARGGVFSGAEQGFVQNSNPSNDIKNKLSSSFQGKLGSNTDPNRTVSYVSAHDNNTLFDKLLLSGLDLETAPAAATQASSMVAFSQGIPFYHAGEELMRQKINEGGTFNENSYNASDEVNSIKWGNKITYANEFEAYKNMIKIRKDHAIFRYGASSLISSNYLDITEYGGTSFGSSTIGYRLKKDSLITDTWNEVYIIHNGNNAGITINSGHEVVYSSQNLTNVTGNIFIPRNTTVIFKAS